MYVRDRIREFRRVKAADLRPNPKNWRVHPPAQHDALRGVLAEIGYAGALLVRELDDGSLELIDGHLRAETTPEMEVPVLVLDLSPAEADLLLAVHDPLAGLAGADQSRLGDLVGQVETECAAVRDLLGKLAEQPADALADPPDGLPREVDLPTSYRVVVECRDEDEQQALYERLTSEGYTCRLLVL